MKNEEKPVWHTIVKYRPEKYDENGVYQDDSEWIGVSCIFCNPSESSYVSLEEYLKVESNYVATLMDIIDEEGIMSLKIMKLEKHKRRYSVLSWFNVDKDVRVLKLARHVKNHDRLTYRQFPRIFKAILRTLIWCDLVGDSGFAINFGYDYYMYVRTRLDKGRLQEIASRHNMYVDPR